MPRQQDFSPEARQEETSEAIVPERASRRHKAEVPEFSSEQIKTLAEESRNKDRLEISEAREELEDPEFHALLDRMSEDLKDNKACCFVATKIKNGHTLMGQERNDSSPGYINFVNPEGKTMASEYAKKFGATAGLRDLGNNSDFYRQEGAAVGAIPLSRIETTTKTEMQMVTEERRVLGFLWKEKVEVQKEVRVPKQRLVGYKMNDVGGKGNQEAAVLRLAYPINEYDNKNNETGRIGKAFIDVVMEKESAQKIMEEMKKNPDNFWKVVNAINPDLLKESPPHKSSGLMIAKAKGFNSIGNNGNAEFNYNYEKAAWKNKEQTAESKPEVQSVEKKKVLKPSAGESVAVEGKHESFNEDKKTVFNKERRRLGLDKETLGVMSGEALQADINRIKEIVKGAPRRKREFGDLSDGDLIVVMADMLGEQRRKGYIK